MILDVWKYRVSLSVTIVTLVRILHVLQEIALEKDMWTYKDERRHIKSHKKSYESLLKHLENFGEFFNTSLSPENILLVTIVHILQKKCSIAYKKVHDLLCFN